EIEGGGGEVEKGVVAVGRVGDQHGRREAALAALETGLEAGIAAGGGFGGAQHLVVAGDQAHVGIDERRGGGQRAHEGVQAVLAVERREAQIGDDEPLRGGLPVGALLLGLAGGEGGQHI